jgi:hypothetical protein
MLMRQKGSGQERQGLSAHAKDIHIHYDRILTHIQELHLHLYVYLYLYLLNMLYLCTIPHRVLT